ncbi:hypothetical protein [Chitinophaga nivalis]|uniref:Bacteriocin n=1 Tax=Chitinophaga nivalis TaxID=2991709 RepID=A0ABT3IVK9_9BACT|nr:hypothetical protein [Chitinophaga nivalis]MCW3462589.1 hypothetical protein [Chitinophaga nivalis]MCW3487720.1 hypothetical protein [Chitinophaga nivalis]
MKKRLFPGKTLDRHALKNVHGGAGAAATHCPFFDEDCNTCTERGCHCKVLGSGNLVCLPGPR